MDNSKCSSDDILLFWSNELSPEKKNCIRAHLEHCSGCSSLLKNLSDTQAKVGELMESWKNKVCLEKALSDLPVREREVVLLRMREEFSFKEIAILMDCPLSMALGRMHNAVKKLKDQLGECHG